jgi:signal transduction histidine kinase
MSNRLSSANDSLRKLDNAKSEFISIASHQLRTPLTAIKGYTSLLLEGAYGALTDKLRETLNKVYMSNERLIALVEDLLNLSRIEAGRMEYKYEKFKMEDLCREIYDTFVIRAKEKKLELNFKYPEQLLSEVTNDRNKLREVVSNLVDNAIKYTPGGWVKLDLSQNGENVRVAVSDSGVGILPEELPHLFEKFTRGKEGAKVNTGGTGLGLHVGRRMMEALHGKIWAESEGAGKGSTFFVEIPVKAGEEGVQAG